LNLRGGGSPPFGFKGFVIGLSTENEVATVLFDKPFIGAAFFFVHFNPCDAIWL
jgi:hypothetical protein